MRLTRALALASTCSGSADILSQRLGENVRISEAFDRLDDRDLFECQIDDGSLWKQRLVIRDGIENEQLRAGSRVVLVSR